MNKTVFYTGTPSLLLLFILSRVYGSVTNNNGLWIGWLDLLTPSFTISLNHNQLIIHSQSSAEPFFLVSRGLAPFSFSFYDWLLIYDWTTYIASRRIYRKHIRCENHIEYASSSIVLFTACCIAKKIIRLLPAYPLPRECVYRVVTQQRVYISQYLKFLLFNSIGRRSDFLSRCRLDT
jgi:hypothetical protein